MDITWLKSESLSQTKWLSLIGISRQKEEAAWGRKSRADLPLWQTWKGYWDTERQYNSHYPSGRIELIFYLQIMYFNMIWRRGHSAAWQRYIGNLHEYVKRKMSQKNASPFVFAYLFVSAQISGGSDKSLFASFCFLFPSPCLQFSVLF